MIQTNKRRNAISSALQAAGSIGGESLAIHARTIETIEPAQAGARGGPFLGTTPQRIFREGPRAGRLITQIR